MRGELDLHCFFRCSAVAQRIDVEESNASGGCAHREEGPVRGEPSTIRSSPAAHSSMRFSPVSISKMNHPGNLGDSVKPRALQAVVAGQLRAGDVVRLPAGEWVFV